MWWLTLLFTQVALAGAVPQASDVVLFYEGVAVEEQGKANYIFTVAGTVAGADVIYPCEANRCSLAQFSDQAQINLTIYKLPEGYPRVSQVVDQATLQEYKEAATVTYLVPNVSTTPAGDGSNGRTFQELQLNADGSFNLAAVSQERNALLQDDVVADSSWPTYLWYIAGGIVVLVASGGGVWLIAWLWKRKF